MTMDISLFDYELPEKLIAKFPVARTQSRLLDARKFDAQNHIDDRIFSDVVEHLKAGDALVVNNTQVIPARIHAHKSSGGKVEVFLERILSTTQALVQIGTNKPVKPGLEIYIEDQLAFVVIEKQAGFVLIESRQKEVLSWFEEFGHTPLPPYIDRADNAQDVERYQTVYAQNPGAVAAPTAGLHFDQALLDQLLSKGVEVISLTLHVGAGTYQPVRVDNVLEHKMHAEWINVDQQVVDRINKVKSNAGRVIAVGTTVVRALETAAQQSGELMPYQGDSTIFIYPGFEFKVVDELITNFHLPKSTLMMMVSAFAGFDAIKTIYQHGIDNNYRFYSYGDAMFLRRRDMEQL